MPDTDKTLGACAEIYTIFNFILTSIIYWKVWGLTALMVALIATIVVSIIAIPDIVKRFKNPYDWENNDANVASSKTAISVESLIAANTLYRPNPMDYISEISGKVNQ